MSKLDRYMEYYEAFEDFYDSNDTSVIEPFFAEDAVYQTTGSAALAQTTTGRDAIMAHFKAALDGLDRKFPIKRRIDMIHDEVESSDGYVKIPGVVHYEIPGKPTLSIHMVEEAWYQGDLIVKLVDDIPEADVARMGAHVAQFLS